MSKRIPKNLFSDFVFFAGQNPRKIPSNIRKNIQQDHRRNNNNNNTQPGFLRKAPQKFPSEGPPRINDSIRGATPNVQPFSPARGPAQGANHQQPGRLPTGNQQWPLNAPPPPSQPAPADHPVVPRRPAAPPPVIMPKPKVNQVKANYRLVRSSQFGVFVSKD